MKSVGQILATKGTTVYTISPRATVYDAVEMMGTENIGALLAIDDGEAVGLISEQDYARKIILQDRSSKDTSVAEIMATSLISVNPSQEVSESMALMSDRRVRHLPVIENGSLAGSSRSARSSKPSWTSRSRRFRTSRSTSPAGRRVEVGGPRAAGSWSRIAPWISRSSRSGSGSPGKWGTMRPSG